jgi:hypothetical protein
LVALWRESLLAQKVLRGETKGYRRHPQLERFRAAANPRAAIGQYLLVIHGEASRRGYSFQLSKIGRKRRNRALPVTRGQLKYEWLHLKRKLRSRNRTHYLLYRSIKSPSVHPSFRLIGGRVAMWERPRRARLG